MPGPAGRAHLHGVSESSVTTTTESSATNRRPTSETRRPATSRCPACYSVASGLRRVHGRHNRCVPDDLVISLPLGSRVLVASDLRLGKVPTGETTSSARQLARAVASWTGPGAIVVAGDLFDLPGPDGLAASLGAHAVLRDALLSFAAGQSRYVLVLPGASEGWLSEAAAGRTLAALTGARVARAASIEMCTAGGRRAVRVEPGPWSGTTGEAAVTGDGRGGRSGELTSGRLAEVVPGLWQGGTKGWLSGRDRLEDPLALPRFVASRLLYRQLGRRAWWLAVLFALPALVALLARLPIGSLRPSGRLADDLLTVALVVGTLELLIVVALAAVSLRQVWLAFSGQAGNARDLNEVARARARGLVSSDVPGFISGGSRRAELRRTGAGFYASTGSFGDVVKEYLPKVARTALPSMFLASRQASWVELESGNELHARLLYGEALLPGASLAERLLARPVGSRPAPDGASRPAAEVQLRAGEPVPALVATYPNGPQWPPEAVRYPSSQVRTRRTAALVVVAAGLLSVLSAVAGPVAHRLRIVSELVPLAVPQAAGALAALAGIALIMLALGIRRGQRRAYVICQVTLATVVVAHLVRGASLLPAIVAAAVAAFLWTRRQFFEAASDQPPVRRAAALMGLVAVTSVWAGTLTLEGSSWITVSLHHRRTDRIGWGRAFLATVERMVAVQHVALPATLNGFFTPAMFSTTAGLVLVAAWLVFRPVVARRPWAGGSLERAREVVRHYGGGTLDYFALRADKQFFFWAETLVAYAVYSGVCLVSPDPVGPPGQRESTWKAFQEHADAHGWSLAVLGASEDWLPIYRAGGMHDLYLGDEAIVRVQDFSLEGGKFKGLRQAVKRVGRYGYTISFHDPANTPPELAAQLRDVMTRSRRGGVERGFSMTLGRVFDKADRGLLLAVVHAPRGQGPAGTGAPVAFCQYVPAPAIKGFSLDLMRRDNGDHPNGLIDFAIVETIRYLAARGYEGLGLNFATMRAVLAGETGDGVAQRVQVWLLRRMSGPMQIESLWRFNAKFDPDWQPRYAVYGSPENALGTALAVARAESFWELPLIGRFLVPPGAQKQPQVPAVPEVADAAGR